MRRLGANGPDMWTWMWKLMVRVLLAWLFEWKVFAAEPSFRVPPENVTVIEGKTAVLRCSIMGLTEKYKVIWTDANGDVITLNEKRILDDQRYSVERPHKQFWNLYIRDVRFSDSGQYICQINTNPAKTKHVSLTVEVPPYIIEADSSVDMVAREGDTVELICNASGIPQPEVMWYKILDDETKPRERIGSQGEMLRIHNVSRDCGGAYVCVADNGVGEPAERQIVITVNYQPEVEIQQKKLGQYLGRETFLICHVTAHPHGVMFWEHLGVQISSSGKHIVDISNQDEDNKKILSLRIKQIENADFGKYTCKAENFIGTDQESLILYDYGQHLRTTTVPTTKRPVVQPSRDVLLPLPPKPRDPPPLNENAVAIRGQKSSRGMASSTVFSVNLIVSSVILTLGLTNANFLTAYEAMQIL